MIIKVFYHSKTGKTTKLAEAIARAVGTTFEAITDNTKLEHADLLFIGDGLHDGKPDPSTERFIAGLDGSKVKVVSIFGVYGGQKKALAEVKAKLKAKGIAVRDESYSCNGKVLGLFSSKHPDDKDLADAVRYANHTLKQVKNG